MRDLDRAESVCCMHLRCRITNLESKHCGSGGKVTDMLREGLCCAEGAHRLLGLVIEEAYCCRSGKPARRYGRCRDTLSISFSRSRDGGRVPLPRSASQILALIIPAGLQRSISALYIVRAFVFNIFYSCVTIHFARDLLGNAAMSVSYSDAYHQFYQFWWT
jgi:hypothetical protein